MKKVSLEQVTGEARAERKAVLEPASATVEQVREKSPEDQLDDAANQVTLAILACFGVSVLFLINAALEWGSGGEILVRFVAAEAESLESLLVLPFLLTGCGAMMLLKKSRMAAVAAVSIYALQSAWVFWLLYAYGGDIWSDNVQMMWGVIRTCIARGIVLALLWRGLEGINTYHGFRREGVVT